MITSWNDNNMDFVEFIDLNLEGYIFIHLVCCARKVYMFSHVIPGI